MVDGAVGRTWTIWQYGRRGRKAVAYKSLQMQIIGRSSGLRVLFLPLFLANFGVGPPAFSSA